MIEKINSINGIGTFNDFKWQLNEATFKRINIFYGNNGAGKTTLTNLFRLFSSVETIDRDDFLKQLASKDEPQAEVEINNKKSSISLGKGPKELAKIYVFNSDFIANHVYDGSKSNMAKFDQNVKISSPEIEEKEAAISGCNKNLTRIDNWDTDKRTAFQTIWNKYYDSFREKLKKDVRITTPNYQDNPSDRELKDVKLELDSKYKEYNQSQNQTQLQSDIAALEAVEFDTFELDIGDLITLLFQDPKIDTTSELSNRIESVKDSLSQTDEELKHSNSVRDWFEDGQVLLNNISNQYHLQCPLCSSDISDRINDLLSDFASVFSNKLGQLVKNINGKREDIIKVFEVIRSNKMAATSTASILDKYEQPKYDILDSKDLENLLSSLQESLSQKEQTPGTVLNVPGDAQDLIKNYNKVVKANKKKLDILLKDLKSKSFNETEIIADLKKLVIETAVIEYNTAPDGLLSNYKKINLISVRLKKRIEDKITVLNQQIFDAKQKLQKESELVNKYLKLLGIHHFEINLSNSEENNISVLYKLTKTTKNSIKHSLSEGEKTALALAYFFSKVHFEVQENSDGKVEETIAIIDDPISSLDEDRLYYTACLIANTFWPESVNNQDNRFQQVFVFSHNLIFLKFLSNLMKGKSDERQDFYIKKSGENVQIEFVPDKLKNFITAYFIKLQSLKDFVDGGISYEEAQDFMPNYVRIILESFFGFKLALTNDKGRSPGLDKIIKNIKGDTSRFKNFNAVEEITSDSLVQKLEDIKRITDKDSHGNVQKLHSFEFIPEDELKKMCNDALNVIRFVDNIHYSETLKEV